MSKIEESNRNSRVTWEGCSVLLDINDGDRLVFARLSPAATLKIGKKSCKLQPLIGCPFGSVFQVENGKDGPYLARNVESHEVDNDDQENGECKGEVESKDNRAIVDNNTAQSLKSEDIDELQRQGATGDEIVEALIANSATFEKKTAFSQEKYRRRKQKKYAPRVLVRRPFARSICEAYFKKHPARIGFLRLDALSLLLSFGNAIAYSDILVVDKVGGILTGAVAERLGGTGYVCNTYLGVAPDSIDIVRIFNFGDEICKRIVQCNLSDLCSTQSGSSKHMQETANCEIVADDDASKPSESMEEAIVMAENGTPEDNPEKASSIVSKACKPAKAGEKASTELINSWKEGGFSSLIVAAAELDAWSIMQKLIPLLSYSAPFAIYHQYLQPLATCMHKLQVEKMAINLQISEPWLREYQVLPSRTHPCMQMSAFGGYILSGTKICSGTPTSSSKGP